MKPHVQCLDGRTVYIRLVCKRAPIPDSLENVVGDGRLFSCPNDVVVGAGSKWTHDTLVTNRFSAFGKTETVSRLGRTISATCVLMLPFGWWYDNRVALGRCEYAQIGYPLSADPTVNGVYAGLFHFSKKVLMAGFSAQRGVGERLLRYEFTCSGREVRLTPGSSCVSRRGTSAYPA